MTAPSSEKAAPIPAEVLELARELARNAAAVRMEGGWVNEAAEPIARAIMQNWLADRASQEERIREDERGKCAKVAEQYGAGYQKGMPLYGAADKDAGRGRQEGHRDAGHAIAALLRREAL